MKSIFIKFKISLIVIIIGIGSTSCETKTIEIIKSGGIWHLNDGVFNDDGKSKKAIIGSEKDVEIAMELFDAYTNLDSQRMVELSEDIVKFHPAEIAGIIDVDASNTSFIDQIQSTFESIDRTVHNVTPIAVEGSDNYTVVGINYTQVITHKDGSISSGHYFERIHVENKKVVRIVQWMRPLE